MATEAAPLRVGYVPEHFLTPLHFALQHGLFPATLPPPSLHPYPSGTGHMITSLTDSTIDLAIGLTDGWIAALANGNTSYKLIGEYVSTPLRWAISTSAERKTELRTKEDLKDHNRLGVSRIGSGSYVMGFVLAEQEGWGEKKGEHFEFVVCDTFKNLRAAVNDKKADAFMWEYFTTKRYYDSGEIRQIGYIDTPWPSWHIVCSTRILSTPKGRAQVSAFLAGINEGIKYFLSHQDEAVKWIAGNLDYTEDDAREWLKTVQFSSDVMRVREEVVEKTVGILKTAGVVKGEGKTYEEMVVEVE